VVLVATVILMVTVATAVMGKSGVPTGMLVAVEWDTLSDGCHSAATHKANAGAATSLLELALVLVHPNDSTRPKQALSAESLANA